MDRFVTHNYVDPDRWPHLTAAPAARFLSLRAHQVTERLETLLSENSVSLEPDTTPSLEVRDGMMIDRIVADGWLGLGESYLIGEWEAEPLPDVLRVLLKQSLETPRNLLMGGVRTNKPRHSFGVVHTGELPEGLVELYSGATRATGGAVFASSSRTSATIAVDRVTGETINPAADTGAQPWGVRRRRGAVTHNIDETWFSAPDEVERRDLDQAQIRRIELMLNEAAVRPGDKVLELPSSGGQLAIHAARRGATVDILTSDEDHASAVAARVAAAGVAGGVRIEVIDRPIPSPRQWAGKYDAIFSVERMETLGPDAPDQFMATVDRLLRPGGIAVVQSLVTTRSTSSWAQESLDIVRAYVWPSLHHPSVQDVRRAAFATPNLKVVAENHIGEHLGATIPLWRSHFLARQRQAAAAGFDVVYRRLWDYQLALYEALVAEGDLDCVQFVVQSDP